MKRPYEWDETDLLGLIQNQTKESTELDYKSCDSLQKTDGKKNELSKDVSAFANSAGGTLVYGITEDGHVPTGFDVGYDPTDITKEWIDQVINSNIRPRINGVLINQVELRTQRPGKVAYVVEIPQSTTAHQAADKRYYKRFNFEAQAMEDYEIRDIMRRASSPLLECQFYWVFNSQYVTHLPIDPKYTSLQLVVEITNHAPTPAEYAVAKLFFDYRLELKTPSSAPLLEVNEVKLMGDAVQVVQVHWAIPGKMPLLQDLPNLLVNTPIEIVTPPRPISGRHQYYWEWEIHSPGMTTTRGYGDFTVAKEGAWINRQED